MKPITKIEIITRPEKIDELKEALNQIGVAGMTVTQVHGYGLTKGHKEIYRGQEYNINFVAKSKLEVVVCEVPVEAVLETAKRVCQTGKIGDGKIFVYPLSNAIRIRTGEEGDIAIMDRDEDK